MPVADELHHRTLQHGRICWRELGAGPPLVLLHGWSMSHAVFSELAALLADDFRLLIPDLPGHGGSERLDPCALKSMAQVLEHWFQSLDLKAVNLLGWSLGGQLALQFATEYPARVKRLILLSSTPRFCAAEDWTAGLSQGELRSLRRGLKNRYLATMGEFFDLQFEGECLSNDRRRQILQFAVRPIGPPDPADALATLEILGREDLRPLLKDIQQQTLVVHGEADRIIPPAAGEYLAKTMRNSRLISLPGIGHAPFLSRPERLAQLLKEFCA